MREEKKLFLWDICELIMLYLLCVILLVAVTYLVRLPLTGLQMIAGAVLSIAVWGSRHRRLPVKVMTAVVLGFLLALTLLTLFCGKRVDSAWDANTYHKLSIGQMKDGWNPVYETGQSFFMEKKNGTEAQADKEQWSTYYPKATWYFAAAMYCLTGNIETGKVINFLFIFATYGICYDYLRRRFSSTGIAAVVAFFLAVTPVSLVQIQSYYLDGILANIFTIAVVMLVAISDRKYRRDVKDLFLMLGASIIIGGNLKYTGLIFLGFFCAAFYIYWLILCWKRKRQQFLYSMKRLTIWYAIVVALTVGIVGASSYVRNTVQDGNPFYPLLGKDKINLLAPFAPDSFQETNGYVDYLKMFFSRVDNVDKDPIQYKIPFTCEKQEFDIYALDIRRGGFGPLFSGIALVCGLILLHALFWLWKCEKDTFWPLALITALSVLLTGITDGSWWARYSPYVWFIVVVGALILLLFVRRHTQPIYRIFSALILCLMLINLLPFMKYPFAYASENSRQIKESLTEVSGRAIYVYFDAEWWGSVYNLEDCGIRYQIVYDREKYSCENHIPALHLYYAYQ